MRRVPPFLVVAVAGWVQGAQDHAHTMTMSMPMTLAEGMVTASVQDLRSRRELVIDLPGQDLPAGMSHDEHAMMAMGLPPVAVATIPEDVWLYGFRVDMVDGAGRSIPGVVLHHLNVSTPESRELFLPIQRRLLAAGQETGEQRAPWLLFGTPLAKGERLVINSMMMNPTKQSYRGAHPRLVLYYVPGGRPWPLFRTYPWQLDCAFPVGDKSWTLPPGHSQHSYEGSPAVPGTIVAIGGHLHEYGIRLTFMDATTGNVIWSVTPDTDAAGHVQSLPVGKLFSLTRLGAHIDPSHRYRVTAEYENPTGVAIPEGAMGVVGGLFRPDRGFVWPRADTTGELYRQDLRHYLRLSAGTEHTHH
ncbi:MAG TPA: hypothetical protein VNH63_12530 [Gemmatimonadales bacterium]|nr:hypothetical protein [Gemmatimonadales bacterium]